MPLLIATRNAGKRREFETLLGDLLPADAEVLDVAGWPTPLPEVIEDAHTFYENAVKKALEMSLETGCTTLADDSGLEVDALGGRPGVLSARYAGPDADDEANNRLLIQELEGVLPADRTARYVAVIALCVANDDLGAVLRIGEPGGDGHVEGEPFLRAGRVLVWFRATCEGRIIDTPRGGGGFGYDPYFLIDDWGQTMAEVSLAQKNERSHRAAATRKLAAHLSA